MIQGVHASSVLFVDFTGVSARQLAISAVGLPDMDAGGHPARLHGADYRLRLGPLHKERRDLVADLHVESQQVPFQSQLNGALRFQKVPKSSRTNVIFVGSCARNFGGLSSAESTEDVRHLANEFCRTLLDMLVLAMEAQPSVAPEPADVKALSARTLGRAASNGTRPAIKGSS